MLRVVFIGDYELGSSLLQGILESSHELVGVVHRMPKKGPKKYKQKFIDFFFPDHTSRIVKYNDIPVLSYQGANSEEFRERVRKLQPDLIIMGSWGEILKRQTIDLPKLAFINCHPSLLPKHRGCNPFSSVILSGENKTGITFHLVSEKIDAGAILMQKELDIMNDDTPMSIKAKCCYLAKSSVRELLDHIEQGVVEVRPQEESISSYYPPVTQSEFEANWSLPAHVIHNQVRGLYPHFFCYTRYNDELLKIGSSRIVRLEQEVHMPGKILCKCNNQLLVSTGDPCHALLIEVVDSAKVIGLFNRIRPNKLIDKIIQVGGFLNLS